MSEQIITAPPESPDRDFRAVFDEGLALIRELIPEWTDHNTSDPGITLLDVLAFALADLHYQSARPIESFIGWGSADATLQRLLEPLEELLPSGYSSTTAQNVVTGLSQTSTTPTWPPAPPLVLPMAPVTDRDYVSAVMGHQDVMMAWFQPNRQPSVVELGVPGRGRLRGCHRILVAHRSDDSIGVLNRLRAGLERIRTIGDEIEVAEVRNADISLCGRLEISGNVRPQDLVDRAYLAILEVLCPRWVSLGNGDLPERSLPALSEGVRSTIGEVFPDRRPGDPVYLSELVEALQSLSGVEAVLGLRGTRGALSPVSELFEWKIEFGEADSDTLPRLSPENCSFEITRRGRRIACFKPSELTETPQIEKPPARDWSSLTPSWPLSEALTILPEPPKLLDELPRIYKAKADEESEANGGQPSGLESYLSLYEALIRTSVHDLNRLGILLSPEVGNPSFPLPGQSISGISISDARDEERRCRILDFLLAWFGEEYRLTLWSTDLWPNQDFSAIDHEDVLTPVEHRRRILGSLCRVNAFRATPEGFCERLRLLHNLSDEEMPLLVEHFRVRGELTESFGFDSGCSEMLESQPDPWSYRATLLCPLGFFPETPDGAGGYRTPLRSAHRAFRELFEETVLQEAPAHVKIRVCWVEPETVELWRSERWSPGFGSLDADDLFTVCTISRDPICVCTSEHGTLDDGTLAND